MRAAAHALACDDAATAAGFAAVDTRLTHPSGTAADCSAFYTAMLWWILDGATVEEAMKRAAEVGSAFKPYRQTTASPGGHCVHSLRLALWAVKAAATFESGIDAAIRTGGDTDTNAAIAGALLGARFGLDDIPAAWRDALADDNRVRLDEEAIRLGAIAL